jgi:hypothetical protein
MDHFIHARAFFRALDADRNTRDPFGEKPGTVETQHTSLNLAGALQLLLAQIRHNAVSASFENLHLPAITDDLLYHGKLVEGNGWRISADPASWVWAECRTEAAMSFE